MPQRKLKLQAHLYLGEEDVPLFFHIVVLRLQLPAGQGPGERPGPEAARLPSCVYPPRPSRRRSDLEQA